MGCSGCWEHHRVTPPCHTSVSGTDTASSWQRCCVEGVRAHVTLGEGIVEGRSASEMLHPCSMGARGRQSRWCGHHSMGPSQASLCWSQGPRGKKAVRRGCGEWRRAGARWAPLHPSLARCHCDVTCGVKWLLLLLRHVYLPSLGRFCFYLTGLHTGGDSGERIPIGTKRPRFSACRKHLTCVHILYAFKGPSGEMHVSFSPFASL